MKRTVKRSGFTIVELIIVIAVIGVLAAVLIPVFSNVIDKSNAKSAYSDAKNYTTGYVSEATSKGCNASDLLIFSLKGGKIFTQAYEAETGSVVEANITPVKFDKTRTFKEQTNEIAAKLFAINAIARPNTGHRFTETENEIVDEAIVNGGFESMVVVPNVEVNVETITADQVQSTGKFEAGNGTVEKPFVIANEEQFANILDLSEDFRQVKPRHFKLCCDIDLSNVMPEGKTTFLNYFSGSIDGTRLDGGSYKIIAPEGRTIFAKYTDLQTTFKNIEWVQGDEISPLVQYHGWRTNVVAPINFINVTVSGKSPNAITRTGNNAGALIDVISFGANFINCKNTCNFVSSGNCSGIFVGYAYNDAPKIKFINCENYGRMSGINVGFFIGNPNISTYGLSDNEEFTNLQGNYKTYLYINGCGNYGTVTATTSAGIFGGTNNHYTELENLLIARGAFVKGDMLKTTANLTLDYNNGVYTAGVDGSGNNSYVYRLQLVGYAVGQNAMTTFTIDIDFNGSSLVAPVVTGGRVVEEDEFNTITTAQFPCFGELRNGTYVATNSFDYNFKVEQNEDGTVTIVLNSREVRQYTFSDANSEVRFGTMTTKLNAYNKDANGEPGMIVASKTFRYSDGAFIGQ